MDTLTKLPTILMQKSLPQILKGDLVLLTREKWVNSREVESVTIGVFNEWDIWDNHNKGQGIRSQLYMELNPAFILKPAIEFGRTLLPQITSTPKSRFEITPSSYLVIGRLPIKKALYEMSGFEPHSKLFTNLKRQYE